MKKYFETTAGGVFIIESEGGTVTVPEGFEEISQEKAEEIQASIEKEAQQTIKQGRTKARKKRAVLSLMTDVDYDGDLSTTKRAIQEAPDTANLDELVATVKKSRPRNSE